MPNPIIKIANAETGEEIERELNAAEYKQYEIDQQRKADQRAAAADKAIAKNALLERLGITADEAALLLG